MSGCARASEAAPLLRAAQASWFLLLLVVFWTPFLVLFLTKPALRRLVMILQRDHQAFHRPQRTERDQHDQRQPQRRMHPIWRLKQDLGHQRSADDDRAGEEHDEY